MEKEGKTKELPKRENSEKEDRGRNEKQKQINYRRS